MHFWIQHNEISKTHLFWFLLQKKSFFLQASVIVHIQHANANNYTCIHKEKSNKMQNCIKIFIIPYLYKAQHVSGDTPPIIRSLKLHWQPLVFHRWKAVGSVVGGRCPPTILPTAFHVWKTRGCQCSFRLLIMGGVSPETCWASYKYEYISICWILLYELYYDARINEHQDYTFSNHTVVGVSR